MPPSTSTCVTCGRAFAENRELAAIPDASTIAFDPGHKRVWRICTFCSEWNLLGTDATVAALPEIVARFAAAVPANEADAAFVPARISATLELLRIGPTSPGRDGDESALRLHAEMEQRKRVKRRAIIRVAPILLLMALAILWINSGHPTVWLLMLTEYGGVGFLFLLGRKVSGRPVKRSTILLGAAALVTSYALLGVVSGIESIRMQLFGLAITVPLILIAGPFMYAKVALIRLKVPGRTIGLTESDLAKVTMSWDASDEITLHCLPKIDTLSGLHAARLCRQIIPKIMPSSFKQLVLVMTTLDEKAYSLLRAVGGLHGLLRALEGFRDDRDGRVLLAELPSLYLWTLELGLGDSERLSRFDASPLHESAAHAALVATEAEALDRESNGG